MGFTRNFPQYWKMQLNTLYGENLGNWLPYFSLSISAFSPPVPILWYTSSYGKWISLPINFPQHRKIPQIQSYWENLGNQYSYFSHNMGACFLLDSHLMMHLIIWEMNGFPHQFPIEQENAAKSIKLEEHAKLVPILSLKYENFSSIRFPSYGIFYHLRNAQLFPSICYSMEKCSETHLMSSQVVFPQYYFLSVLKSGDSMKEQ